MTIPVQDIVDRVTDLLIDKDRDDADARWSTAELLRWINDSRAAIMTRRPEAGGKFQVSTLVAGSMQAIPDNAVALLDVVRNMGMDGATPGRSIRRTDRQNIDDTDPNWHTATPSAEISQFTYDDRMPYNYFVSPPAVAGTKVLVGCSTVPAAVTSVADSLDIDMQYMEPIVNYVAYRAKSKDSQYANAGEAAAFYSAFTDALGGSQQAKTASSPNQIGNSV